MEVLHERCCGLDVHLAELFACVMSTNDKGKVSKERRRFSTVTADLRELVAWLKSLQVKHVAMESTGVYWVPIHAVLEEADFDVTVANAQHVKKVPGRKTDVSDAEWMAGLLRCGLLRKSFIPPADFRAIRDLTRARRSLGEDRVCEVNRVHKLLITANVKLSAVISDIFGVSGVEMIRALLDGKMTPQEIARLARGTMRQKIPDIERAVECTLLEHHKLLLRQKLEHIDLIDRQIAALDDEIAKRFEPYKAQLELLDTIPGVDRRGAEQILAETGVDMSAFRSDRHLAAWAGVAPGNNESAGKNLGARRRSGNVYLTTILVELAHGGVKTKNSYLNDKYHRLKARRGAKRAALAIGHKIIRAVHAVLTKREPYKDLGASYLDQRDRDRVVRQLCARLERLGVDTAAIASAEARREAHVPEAQNSA